jgi:S1-C subfamily serine protease
MMKYRMSSTLLLSLGLLQGCSAMPLPSLGHTSLTATEQNTIALFERSNPSVVSLNAKNPQANAWEGTASGTGFVWDKQGHIVTTQHLIQGQQFMQVRLSDQRTVQARVLGYSATQDLAVLQLPAIPNPPPAATLGNSTHLKVGQHVFSIGNAFDLGPGLTEGLISALDRTFGDEQNGAIYHLIQTDAAINPGSSGAPLLNSAGQVIGVNVAIYSLSGGSEGVGFAIPVDIVKQVINPLINQGAKI